MVAAWISADTGVGPAMASGSHTCSGNWADLPMAPPNSRNAATIAVPAPIVPLDTSRVMCGMLAFPWAANVSTKMPNMNGMSPVFVVMNALMAAFEFSFSSHQCPMSRYEQIPTNSQPTSSWNRLSAMTRFSIEPVNRDSAAKNHVYRMSSCM